MLRVLSFVGQSALIVFASVCLLELAAAVYYFSKHSWSVPPMLGGPPLNTRQAKESFAFDPISLYSVADQPLNEGLWARLIVELPPREKGEFRVFMLGGSTVANLRMPPGERIVDSLESDLRTSGHAWRVVR